MSETRRSIAFIGCIFAAVLLLCGFQLSGKPESGVLMSETSEFKRIASQRDAPYGAPVLGNDALARSDVETISFLDSIEDAPAGAWDVSTAQDMLSMTPFGGE